MDSFKNEYNVEHEEVDELPKIENEHFRFTKTEWNWNSESANNEIEGLENSTGSENLQMPESNETSIILEIKIEDTQIGNEAQNVGAVKKKQLQNTAVKCPSCDYVAKKSHCLYYHKRTAHGTKEDKFKCQFCSSSYNLKYKLFNHIKNNHKQLIKTLKAEAEKTRESSYSTNKSDSSTSNMSKKLQQEEFSSHDSVLQKKAKQSTSDDLKIKAGKNIEYLSDGEFIDSLLNINKIKHPRSQVSELTDRRQCDECGKIFNYYGALYSHKQIHKTEEEKLPCPHCERKFKRNYELKNHVKRYHATGNPIKCPNCSFATESQSLFNMHVRMFHTERPFKCDVCSKTFTRKDVLKTHIHSHSGITFTCDICFKSYTRNRVMQAHRRRHNIEK